jgi:hypothetical protein
MFQFVHEGDHRPGLDSKRAAREVNHVVESDAPMRIEEKPLDLRWKVTAPYHPRMEATILAAEGEAGRIYIIEKAQQSTRGELEVIQDP